MTNEQILKQAIEKAAINGVHIDGTKGKTNFCASNVDFKEVLAHPEILIFSHDFAKAFWGEKFANCDRCGARNEKDCHCLDAGVIDSWKYHLQQMVLEEQPLKYIEKYL